MSEFSKGFLCSSIAVIVTYPFDTFKTHRQIFSKSLNNFKINNVKTLFRGLNVQLLTYPIFWGVYFQNQKLLRSYSGEYQSIISNIFMETFLCSTFGTIIANPLFVIKTRLQVNNDTTFIQVTKDLIKNEGIKGLFKGTFMSICNNMKLMIQMPLYYKLKDDWNYSIEFSSFLSKSVANTMLYPTDVVRSQMRYSTENIGNLQLIKRIYKSTGISGFYRGFLWYNCVSIPNFMIFMFLKDRILI